MLLDPKLLQAWAPYSLLQRVQIIEQTYHVSITQQMLGLFYRSRNVRHRNCNEVYRQGLSNNYVEQRKDFAQLLGNIVAKQKPLIYMDESAFTTWMMQKSSWSLPDKPNYHVRNNKRHAVTVFGAIGNCLSEPVYMLGKSTNQKEFQ